MAQFPSFSYGNQKTFGDMVRESRQFNWINVTLYPTSAGSWTDLDPKSQLKIERLSLLTDESLKDETVDDWCKEMGNLAQICEGSSCICLHMIGIKGHGLTQLESLLNISKRITAFKLTEFSFRGEFSLSEQLTENSVFGEFLEIQSSSLQSVVIGNFRLSSMHMRHIGKVLQSRGSMLQELLFCETKIEETGVQLLAESMQSPENKLRELWLQWSEIGDEGARLISEALQSANSRLEDLDLQHNNIGDEGAKWLAKALQSEHTRLRKLILNSNRIGDEGAKLLGESLCSQYTRLEELSLPDNRIGDEGAKYVAQGAHGGVLKELNLSTNKGINESGTIAIAECLQQRRNSLARLYLTRCNNGENGVKHVAKMLQDPCCQLTFLSIDTPSENDVIAIAESLHASKIQSLSLHSAHANDYLRGDSAAKKLLSALDSSYWCPLRSLRIEGSSSPQVARTIGSLISRNKAIDDGDLLRFDRVQPSTAKLFVCGDRTEFKQELINSILQQSRSGKKKSQSLMNLSLTSFECGENIKKLLVSDVQQSDGYFPFFSARPRHSLFLVLCRISLATKQPEIDLQLGYWLKSIYSSSSYHGPNAKVILCLDFSKEYYSSLGKGKNRDGIIRATRIRTRGIIKKFEHVIDFGPDDGIDNIFATVQGERSDLKKMKNRIQTLFMELQRKVSRIPKLCVDLLQFLPQLWKNECPPFPIITFNQLVFKFEKSHADLRPSRLNVQTALQLLDSSGYVIYNPTAGIILLALEFFAYLAHYLESLESASVVQDQEDIAVELNKKMHVEVDLVYKVVHCLHFAGIIRPKDERWDGDTDKIPKKFLLPSAVSELPRWREDASNKQFFWGRRLECADKETMAIPQQLFAKLQPKQNICTMGSEWMHLIENSIQVIVRIGKEDEEFVGGKQWIDVMFRVPEESKHDLNQHVILAFIINQIHTICYGDSVCPTVELQEKVIPSDAVKSLQLRDVQTEFLCLIMAELSEYGVEHSHVWKTGTEPTKLEDLLSRVEIDVHRLNKADELIKDFELDAETLTTGCPINQKKGWILQAADVGKLFQLLGLGKVAQIGNWLSRPSRLERVMNERFDNMEMRFDKLEMRFDNTEMRFDNLEKRIDDAKMTMERRFQKLDKFGDVLMSTMTNKMLQIMNLVDPSFPKLPYLKNKHGFMRRLFTLFENEVSLHFMCEWEGGAHEVDAQGFKFKYTREWVVKAAPALVPTLKIVAFGVKMTAAGFTTGAIQLPWGPFAGQQMIQKATVPELLREFAAGLEAELKNDWCAKPDPSLLKDLLQHVLQGKQIHLRNFGLCRVHSTSGPKYLCDRHSRGFQSPPISNQQLHL